MTRCATFFNGDSKTVKLERYIRSYLGPSGAKYVLNFNLQRVNCFFLC